MSMPTWVVGQVLDAAGVDSWRPGRQPMTEPATAVGISIGCETRSAPRAAMSQ